LRAPQGIASTLIQTRGRRARSTWNWSCGAPSQSCSIRGCVPLTSRRP